MFLLYVDESGDTGLTNSPTNYFVLTGLVMHELSWRATLDALIAFRKMLRQKYGLKLREEIHAQEFINSPGPVKRIIKSRRLQILRDVLDFEAGLADVNIISVRVDKRGKASNYDVLEHAWRALIQRFHNTISHRNFPGPANSKTMASSLPIKPKSPLSCALLAGSPSTIRFRTCAILVTGIYLSQRFWKILYIEIRCTRISCNVQM